MAAKSLVFAPLPSTVRGQGIQLDSNNTNFVYSNGRSIVIRNLKNPEIASEYSGHAHQTTVARYSPTGYYIASADIQGTVKIWDTINEEHILKTETKVFSGKVNDLAWDSESKRIIGVGEGKEKFGHAFTFDTATSVGEVTGHNKAINSVSIRPQRPYRAVTASDDMSVNFYYGVPYKFQKSIKDHTRFVQCVKYAPDGSIFVSVGSDGKIFTYEGKEGEKVGEIKGNNHTGSIYSLAFSKDSKKIITTSADATVKLWDIQTQQLISKCDFSGLNVGNDMQQVGALWTNDYIMSVSLNGEINYLDEATFTTPSRVIKGHQKGITALSVGKDETFYTGSYDGRVMFWDMKTKSATPVTGKGHSNQVMKLVDSGNTVLSVGMDDTLRLIDTSSHKFIDFSLPTKGLPKSITTNGTFTVISTAKSEILLIENNVLISTIKSDKQPTSVALSNCGTELAVGHENASIKFYLISSDKRALNLEKEVNGNKGEITCISYSPDNIHVAASDSQRSVMVYNKEKELVISEWIFHTSRVNSIKWSKDGKKACSGSVDASVEIWQLNEPMKHLCIKGAHLDSVTDAAFLNESTIVSVGNDGFIKIWTLTGR